MTNGAIKTAKKLIGGAMRQATPSGFICPRRFGTNSPSTMEKYVTKTTTNKRPAKRAVSIGMLNSALSHAATGVANAASPTMPERMPMEVIPT